MRLERFPIALRFRLPLAKPMEPVTHVGNLVLVDLFENRSAFGVSDFSENAAVVVGVVEVGLFEGQTETGNIIDRRLHA